MLDDDEGVGKEAYDLVRGIDYETARVTTTVEIFKERIESTKVQVFSFYETQMTPKVIKLSDGSYGRNGDHVIIVGRDSVALGIPGLEELLSAQANHSTIVKFKNEQDPTYRTVYDRLNEIIRSAEAAAIQGLANRELSPTLQAEQRQMISEIRKWIPSAQNAAFDSYIEDGLDAKCHPGTRTDLLCQIRKWAKGSQGTPMFWLNGMAGTGKSTIARTIAQSFEEGGLLGASFFFKRGESGRDNASKLFTTIATQFLQRVPELISHIQASVDEELDIAAKSLEKQFNSLIFYPLKKLSQPLTLVLVIDALDECEGDERIRQVIYLLAKMQTLKTVYVRVFLTSRPELPVRLGFCDISSDIYEHIQLQDVPSIEHDISVFLKAKFSNMKRDFNECAAGNPLPLEWPGGDVIEKLTKMAIPLFIFAATICRFVEDKIDWDPEQRLTTFLEYGVAGASQLDQTYLPVLKQLEGGRPEQQLKRSLFGQEFREIVGPIVILANSLSIKSLADLLGKSQKEISTKLHHLHSVLSISKASVRLLHLSFREFLTDSKKKRSDLWFWIDEEETHSTLTKRCLKILSLQLKENICSLASSGMLREDIDTQSWQIVDKAPLQVYSSAMIFTPETSVIRAQFQDHISKEISKFPKARQFWGAELQSIEGHRGSVRTVAFSSDGTRLASGSEDGTVRLWDIETGEELKRLEVDSKLVLAIVFCFDSTLALGSDDGITRLWDTRTGKVMKQLEDDSGCVIAVAFSCNGMLASGSEDGIIRFWDTETGKVVKRLEEGSGRVTAVVFSCDGKQLASASAEQIRLWDVTTGEVVRRLKDGSEWVLAVSFSCDGTLASGSDDGRVRLWDAVTGEMVKQWEGHRGPVAAVAFSCDGKQLASGSDDRTVRLWDVTTGDVVRRLEGHSGWVTAVAFSPDGMQLASGSRDGVIKLWDTVVGERAEQLEGNSWSILAVAFSSDSTRLASGSADGTVMLWDPATGKIMMRLKGHSNSVNAVAFCSDGKQLASGSNDRTVKLWNTETWEVERVEEHDERVLAVAFSPNGTQLASTSADGQIRLWDAATRHKASIFMVPYSTNVLEFSNDGGFLRTGQENLAISSGFDSSLPLPPQEPGHISLLGEWITRDRQNFLWLPHEYRGDCSAVKGNTIAIGQKSGTVSFFEFA
ncbi:hypothetical protein TWF718_000434 [Orbilia javanica]|uniref:Mitochondrial division protein 1 n=1 Tax=Orbilia javanica TaxID=47235 RepID=A0AAN8N809_9PEZI